ncbi:MAG: lamin tail domain-containing protein, partial [Myxococcales bacterium]|nr:lamin tail domain-containing protein [Myxococcales bacterium]
MTSVRTWMHGFVFLVLGVSGCGREAVVGSIDCDDRAPGDLVITEVHANPAGSDGEGEYIEIFNASGAPLELEGLTLTVSRSDGGGAKSHRFTSASI